MLGGLRAVVADRTITRFQTQKTGALLAYLALHLERPHQREALAQLLWPEADPTAGRNRLNQAVSSLRRQLHPPGSAPNEVIVATAQTLQLNRDGVTTDVEEFERLLESAQERDDESEKAAALHRAVNLYHGELLDPSTEEWALAERGLLGDRCYDALTFLVRYYAQNGRLADAIEIANRRLAQDPGEERSHRALIRLYLMSGRPQSALAQFAELERNLAIEGDTPSERALLLRREAVAALAQFANESEPMISATVTAPNGLRDSAEDTRFFGRQDEIKQVLDALAAGCRAITIVGLGGVGKTRLAVESGRRLSNLGTTAVFIDAHEVAASEGLVDAMERSRTGVQTPCVLIVDQLEHLVDDLYALERYLQQHGDISILGTSRRVLGLAGEQVVSLDPLPVPSNGTIEELGQNPAIALFVSRAQAVRQDFQLTERTAGAIVSLCRRLEGWPLALELAATWARTLTPKQMDARVGEHFDQLASRRRDLDPRHRSMRAAIQGSFESLPSDLKGTFLRLAVFEGGWDHAAGVHLCPGVDHFHAISMLVDANLVRRAGGDGSPRFRMFETVRAFARDLTAPDLCNETRHLHAEYYRQLVRRGERRAGFLTSAMASDQSNLRAAIDYWFTTGRNSPGVEMTAGLVPYWEVTGRLREGIAAMERAAPHVEGLDASEHGLFLTRYARLLWLAGRLDEADEMSRRAMDLFTRSDDLERLVELTHNTAVTAHRRGDCQGAYEMLASNVALARQMGNDWFEARSSLAMGHSLVELSRLDEARVAYEGGLAISRNLDDDFLVGAALASLANLMRLVGDYETAQAHLGSAIDIYRAAGLNAYWIDANVMLARLHNETDAPTLALEVVCQVLEGGVDEPVPYDWVHLEAAYALRRLDRIHASAKLMGFVEASWARESLALMGLEADLHLHETQALRDALGNDALSRQLEAGRKMDRQAVKHLIEAEADQVRKVAGTADVGDGPMRQASSLSR